MSFNKKDVVVGFAIIFIIIIGVFLYSKNKQDSNVNSTPEPVSVNFRKDFEESFKINLPEDKNAIELKDVSGGSGRGIATDSEILADLDTPESGYFYQAWMEKEGGQVLIGKLNEAKGGWLIDYDLNKYPDYKKIVISLEKDIDSNLETRILEGSF